MWIQDDPKGRVGRTMALFWGCGRKFRQNTSGEVICRAHERSRECSIAGRDEVGWGGPRV